MKTKLLAATALVRRAACSNAIAQTPTAAPQAAGAASATNANDSQRHEAGYNAPKTAWGAPDLQGFWNNTSITSHAAFARREGAGRVSRREADRLVNRNVLSC